MSRLTGLAGVVSALVLVSLALSGCTEVTSVNAQAEVVRSDTASDTEEARKLIPDIKAERAFPALTFARPVLLTHAGDGSDRIFVLEQAGKIHVFPNKQDVKTTTVFLDWTSKTYMGHNEEGLLALAFHPKYATNGLFYIYYSMGARRQPRYGVLSQFKVDPKDPNKADAASEKVLIKVDQPWGNHNGASLNFGPDGFLYFSLGDGGSANDPLDAGQRMDTLLGKILRIDVDSEDKERKLPYGIPKDNPCVDREGARPEIWAWGLRNVWRMAFDNETGLLYAGDVGQNLWEEIDIIEKGGNYGWNIREGAHDFKKRDTKETLIDPIAEYKHPIGLSITGGEVYRGSKHEVMKGTYYYSDFATGITWGLRYDEKAKKVTANRIVNRDRLMVASYGRDQDGELYLCVFAGDNYEKGQIRLLSPRVIAAKAADEKQPAGDKPADNSAPEKK